MSDTSRGTAFQMERSRAVTGIPQEEKYRYSRAVRTGHRVVVSGSSALWGDGSMNPDLEGDLYGQARVAASKIEKALTDLGSSLAHVVRVNFYITDSLQTDAAANAFRDFFGLARPAFTLVGVPFLVGPELLVEIDAEAID